MKVDFVVTVPLWSKYVLVVDISSASSALLISGSLRCLYECLCLRVNQVTQIITTVHRDL